MIPKTGRLVTLALVAVALASGAARGDIITFTDGSKIEGQVVSEDPPGPCRECAASGKVMCKACRGAGRIRNLVCEECRGSGKVDCDECGGTGKNSGTVVVRIKGMKVSFSRRDIARIERKAVPEDVLLTREQLYRSRVEKAGKDDAKAQFELGKWCFEKDLRERAYRHFAEAGALDEKYRRMADPFVRQLASRFDAAVKLELGKALDLLRSGELVKGAEAIDAIVKENRRAPLVKDAEAQGKYLDAQAPDIAKTFGRTLVEISATAVQRAATACAICKGQGRIKCTECAGSGDGTCPKCKGQKKTICDNCTATGRELCLRCLGTGKEPKERSVMGITRVCTRCGGRKTIECTACEGKRFVKCPKCAGEAVIKAGCKRCGGKGTSGCPGCLGTGLIKVARFRWGPVPSKLRQQAVIVPRKGVRSIWQGSYRGAIVTVAQSDLLFRGALKSQLNSLVGKSYTYLVVCIDNREGAKQIRFASGERTIRLVLDDATQAEVLPADEIRKKLGPDKDLRKAADLMGDLDVLPGVMSNLIAILPSEVDPGQIKSIYWGRADPWRLTHKFVDEAEVKALRKTVK